VLPHATRHNIRQIVNLGTYSRMHAAKPAREQGLQVTASDAGHPDFYTDRASSTLPSADAADVELGCERRLILAPTRRWRSSRRCAISGRNWPAPRIRGGRVRRCATVHRSLAELCRTRG